MIRCATTSPKPIRYPKPFITKPSTPCGTTTGCARSTTTSCTPDGLPHGSGAGQPVMDKALRLNVISIKLTAIERALSGIPPEYRRGVLDNVRYGAPYPYTAGYATWSRWRRRFLWLAAKYLRLL